MNIEAKFELLACCTNEMPQMVIVCATPFVSRAILSIARHGFLGALQRGGIGQLDVADDSALILLRDKARGGDFETPIRQYQ